MKYRKFVAHCSVFCRFCPLTPTHTLLSLEKLAKCVPACLCFCQFSYSVCVCVCVRFCLSELCSPLTVSWCTRVSHAKDQHMDSEQQLFIWRDLHSFRAVTPCYQSARLSSGAVDWKAPCLTFALAYSDAMHMPDWRDADLREFRIWQMYRSVWQRWNLILRFPTTLPLLKENYDLLQPGFYFHSSRRLLW